ncbi:peptidase M15 [Marinobacter salsuginis]|uniref:peptidase M15 n=1 Tax=Marinobacter salsuginis TaxID=418719 RepID=UPI001ADF1A2A|nr:peptidase M15 [Marinobacter salsuginis]QTN41442.1 peptidase M15 [Marinobacter salsuginis]
MRSPQSVKALEDLGRVRLSDSFFMRDFLYSEISQIECIPNVPEYPDIAIEAGRALCQDVLEPIQNALGRISIRSGYRSPAVNAKGAENKNQYNCSSNESNYAHHIWDYRDKNGELGATACIVVNSFVEYYEKTGDWQSLAWWIHDNVPAYSSMYFFPKLAAVNIRWSQTPEKWIKSHIPPRGTLTKPGKENQNGNHEPLYLDFLRSIRT